MHDMCRGMRYVAHIMSHAPYALAWQNFVFDADVRKRILHVPSTAYCMTRTMSRLEWVLTHAHLRDTKMKAMIDRCDLLLYCTWNATL